MDGISEEVGYSKIRVLFAHIGRIRKVFVQRKREVGRRFRFGFVHFLSWSDAETVVA